MGILRAMINKIKHFSILFELVRRVGVIVINRLAARFCLFVCLFQTPVLTVRALHVRSSDLPVFADLQVQTGSCCVQVPQTDGLPPVIGQMWSRVGQSHANPARAEENGEQHVCLGIPISVRSEARGLVLDAGDCSLVLVGRGVFCCCCFDLAHLAS